MNMRKPNKIVHVPKCVLCPRDMPSFEGECFVAIPCNLNENGKWKGAYWYLFCGNCFKDLIKKIGIEKKPIGEVDFMNLFLGIPISIFKEKYMARVEFKQY